MMTHRHTEDAKRKISEAQRRSWAARREMRMMAVKKAKADPAYREKCSLAQRERYARQRREAAAIAGTDSAKAAPDALREHRAKPKRHERMPISKALAEVHRRIARREAKQAKTHTQQRQPARLWNLKAPAPAATRTAEPPPMPELQGWQKILCGRLG